jgi:transcriptional regulator with XRE-family HTH domain
VGMKNLQRTAAQRVQARVRERLGSKSDRRRTQKELAGKLGIAEPSLSELLNGKASERGLLHHLDTIAEYLGVPPSLLVAKAQSPVVELRKHEPKLLAHFRMLPNPLQMQVLAVFEHFAGLLPEEREARYWWSKIRRVKRSEDRGRLDKFLDDVLLAQRTDPTSTDGRVAPHPAGATAPANQPRSRVRGSADQR